MPAPSRNCAILNLASPSPEPAPSTTQCTFHDPETRLLPIQIQIKEGRWQPQECRNQPPKTP